MIIGVDNDLGRSLGGLEGREAVLEDGDLKRGERDLGRRTAGPRRAERAVFGVRQEGALLAVDGVDDVLPAQLVEAPHAHARANRISARPSSLSTRTRLSGPYRSSSTR